MRGKDFAFGFCAAIAGRALIPKLLLLKFGRDVKRLNEGDYSGLLAAYSEDFVLEDYVARIYAPTRPSV
jgi:hypothetical protein